MAKAVNTPSRAQFEKALSAALHSGGFTVSKKRRDRLMAKAYELIEGASKMKTINQKVIPIHRREIPKLRKAKSALEAQLRSLARLQTHVSELLGVRQVSDEGEFKYDPNSIIEDPGVFIKLKIAADVVADAQEECRDWEWLFLNDIPENRRKQKELDRSRALKREWAEPLPGEISTNRFPVPRNVDEWLWRKMEALLSHELRQLNPSLLSKVRLVATVQLLLDGHTADSADYEDLIDRQEMRIRRAFYQRKRTETKPAAA
jgi:hypothetical protein